MSLRDMQETWRAPKSTPDLPPAELARWKTLTAKTVEVATKFNWSKSECARRSDTATGTFSQWYDGTYKGTIANISNKVEQWLASVEEIAATSALIPAAPGFVVTPTARELSETLLYAQTMAEMVVVTLGAGMGKTMTATSYQAARPHTYLVTMRPTTATVHGMLMEFSQALEVHERNAARLDRAIGDKLRRNGRHTLLIVDEAQHLVDNAINQLRYFLDNYQCGIALLGNEELYGRFGGVKPTPAYAQINRRIGKRLRRLQPLAGDIDAIIAAWGVSDTDTRKLCAAIGRKPGALSQITKTMQLAGMYAAGEKRDITAADVKAAWSNRGGEMD